MSAPAEIRELEVQNPATSLLIARRLPPFLVEMTKPLFGDSLLELHELKRERRIFTTITSFILQCGLLGVLIGHLSHGVGGAA